MAGPANSQPRGEGRYFSTSPHLGNSIDHRDLVLVRWQGLSQYFDCCLCHVFLFNSGRRRRHDASQSSRGNCHDILNPLIERSFDLLQFLSRYRSRGCRNVWTGALVDVSTGTGICSVSAGRSRCANDERLGRRYVQRRQQAFLLLLKLPHLHQR